MAHDPTRRLYIAAPALATAALSAAVAALLAAGFLVTTATEAAPVDADELLAVMAEDMDAARAADAVVTLPGAEDFPEPVYAALFSVPVVTLADALAGAA
ncbi:MULTISPECIES: hypothetical protein [unclassified Micromonospora]|uniref:hypothetical protein n=1 Tax=unclassified Micromonospora TaxID=2617518 RepID=UPI0022B5ECF0|nr:MULTISPECIES: hypothetical protein [unclassified Micromonospora]MCZ7421647.1 hypothetical protein [Verrucosispora sp. WMMA2121]WBB93674.1 hypothetical protein O7597_12215 [Verrucosispora sp. WMMC514]